MDRFGNLRFWTPATGVLLLFVVPQLVGCAGMGIAGDRATERTYSTALSEAVHGVERTLSTLDYRIERFEEDDQEAYFIAFSSDAFARSGGAARDPRFSEVTVTVTLVGPERVRIDLQMPPASSYQIAPSRERVDEFFRVFEGMGFERLN
jgi:hypothetical protein